MRGVCLIVAFFTIPAAIYATPFTTIDYPGSAGSRLSDINNSGEILGTYFGASGSGTFVMQNGTFTPLSYPGAETTVALGLSNTGEIAGWYLDGSGNQHGFLWNDGTYSDFSVKDATSTYLTDVNSSGQLLGGYCVDTTCHGFFTAPDGFHNLDVPGADRTNPVSINDHGVIVGSTTRFGFGTGFIRATDGTLTPIMVQDPASPVSETVPSGINSDGMVIGYTGFKFHGFLWRDGIFTPFNVAMVDLPQGINDLGWVVGTYTGAGGDHGFLAKDDGPVPEPASLALLLSGAVGLALLRRRVLSLKK